MSDDLEHRKRRALYRASHRGTKEMDWLLGRYAADRLPAMGADELAEFEELLALPDPDLHGWIVEPVANPDGALDGLIRRLRIFHGLAPKG